MFEKFTSENIDNFRQRYEGTYGFYRDESKKRLLVKLTEIGSSRCSFVDADGIEFHLNPDTKKDIGFEFLPPRSSWYNTPLGAMYCERVAQRQFSRGITSKNILIYLLASNTLVPQRVDFASLGKIFNSGKPSSLADALKNGRSYAIATSFALDPHGAIFLFGEAVGMYKQEKNVFKFKLNEPELWKTEITDALRALQCSAEVA